MAKETIVPAQGIREKHLNIVYFIDSSRSHSIRINLTLARWLVAFLVGIVLWGVLSIGWIMSLGITLERTRDHLGEALSSLFKYQVKYDRVFEQAYPDDKTQSYYAPGSQLASNNPVAAVDPKSKAQQDTAAHAEQKQVVAAEVSPEKQAPEKSAPEKAASAAAPAVNTTAAAVPASTTSTQTVATPSTNSLAIDISNASLVAQDGKMVFVFDITNKDQKKKAEGYIWATASIVGADGSTKHIVAPAHSKINPEGNVDAYTSTYKFSIQRFKRKDFSFNVPKDTGWKIADLKLNFVDSFGKQKKVESINVPVKFKEAKAENATKDDDASQQSDEAGANNP